MPDVSYPFHDAAPNSPISLVHWSALLRQMPAILFELGPERHIRYIEGHGLSRLQVKAEDLQGQPVEVLQALLPDFSLKLDEESDGFQSMEGRLTSGDSWQSFVLPLSSVSPVQTGWLGYLWLPEKAPSWQQDQTPLLAYFIKHAPAAIAMFDREMRYLMVSDQWMDTYKLDTPILGKSYYEVFPETPDRWRRVHQRCLSGVIERCEADPFPHADGHVDYINWVVAPWYQGEDEVGGLILYTEQVNDQVEARANLRRLNEELTRSNERLSDFAAALSHTLREPLSLAIAHGQQLIHELEQSSEPDIVQRAEGWLNHLYRVESSLGSLLTHAHLDGTIAMHPISLDDVLAEVLANLRDLIAAKHAQVHVGRLPEIMGNEFELIALFQQLVVDALAYSEADPPEVLIAAERQDGRWCFRVQDNGVGLTKQQIKTLFDFKRAQDLTQIRGNGVGLPVCQRIVSHLGGEIWVESVPGKGTTFFFTVGESKA